MISLAPPANSPSMNTAGTAGLQPILNSAFSISLPLSPGAILVSQQLTGDNYSSWKRAMEMALIAKNKIGFVNGFLPKPSDESDSDPLSFFSKFLHHFLLPSYLLKLFLKHSSMATSSQTENHPTFLEMDYSNPYFLHHGDSPGAILVSQQLTGDNYSSWKRAMEMALTAKNKIGFVNGSLPKPSDESDSDPLSFSWCRCNNMLLSWLLNSVSKEIAASIIYIDSAADIWMDLQDRFSHLNGPRVFQLQQTMSSLSQGNDSVSTYFTSLKGIWDELDHQEPLPCCTCGAVKVLQAKHQRKYVYQFLIGLNESNSHVRGQILLLDPLPPMNKVFSLVLQEERQCGLFISSNSFNQNTTALLTKTTSSSQNRINNKTYQNRKDRPTCSHCGITGHTMEKYYKLHGFPPRYKFTKGKNTSLAVNQVSSETDNPQLPITYEQCQQLMNMFKPAFLETFSTQAKASPEDIYIPLVVDRIIMLASQMAVVIFSKSSCCMCHAIKRLFYELGTSPGIPELDEDSKGREKEEALVRFFNKHFAYIEEIFSGYCQFDMDKVMRLASEKGVVIFSNSSCCMCYAVKILFHELGVNPLFHYIDQNPEGREMEKALVRMGCSTPVPAVFIDGKLIGSTNEVMSLHLSGSLVPMLKPYQL
ncbi:hypothetical protein HHK36_026560 [Tetracentron sinense]|uniref:Uncharacterized protein n=1 Tax=Tetracentron sinense TaxID=13715 RepID=A0A835D2A8_TETSI|nr:hypothetical protein HHK36_026560 [Tetracentron sinense]